MVFLTILKQAAKRAPMIKFLGKRGPDASYKLAGKGKAPAKSSAAKAPAKGGAKPAKSKASMTISKGPVLEDWQLPAKYRRLPFSQIEIDYINCGGPPHVKKAKPAPKKGAPKKGAPKKGVSKKPSKPDVKKKKKK